MYVEWTKNLQTEQEKKDFSLQLFGNRRIMDRLKDILQDKENHLDRTETDIRVFESPNWAYRQAFKNGQREALGFLKKLTDLDQQKEFNLNERPVQQSTRN